MKLIQAFFLSLFWLVSIADAATWYISPTGSDAAAGTTGAPFRTFAHAFGEMSRGDTLYLKSGTYSEAAGTGYISYIGTGSAQAPSGLSRSQMTLVKAETRATVVGLLFVGRVETRDSCIRFENITFLGGGEMFHSKWIYIKSCGFYRGDEDEAVFGIGEPVSEGVTNTKFLMEDSWIWGQCRLIAANYIADSCIWRRVVIRGDGCNVVDCQGEGNPNVGITAYNSQYVSLQNVIVVDRVLGGGSPYGNFATAQHDPGSDLGPNEWLGCLSLNGPDAGYYFEAEVSVNNAITMRNCVSWDNEDGFNIQNNAFPATVIENCTAGDTRGGSGFRTTDITSGTLRSLLSIDAYLYGFNCNVQPSYTCSYGADQGDYNQTTPSNAITTNPTMSYICRIETGSTCDGTGYVSSDRGANIIHKYGTDGTFFGETGYNTLTANALWPYPNEAQIRSDFLSQNNESDESRGFCDDAVATSLTEYVWEYQYGNANPYGAVRHNGVITIVR